MTEAADPAKRFTMLYDTHYPRVHGYAVSRAGRPRRSCRAAFEMVPGGFRDGQRDVRGGAAPVAGLAGVATFVTDRYDLSGTLRYVPARSRNRPGGGTGLPRKAPPATARTERGTLAVRLAVDASPGEVPW